MTQSAAESAVKAFGFAGHLVTLALAGGPVSATIELDPEETDRRQRLGVGPIIGRGVINALWELPHRTAMPVADIPDWVLDRVKSHAPWTIELHGDRCMRTVTAPATITGAIAAGRNPSRLLDRVGQLSAICPMAIVVPRHVPCEHPALLDAALYGTGIAWSGDGWQTVAQPEPVSPTPGPFRWWLAELAYEALLARRAQAMT